MDEPLIDPPMRMDYLYCNEDSTKRSGVLFPETPQNKRLTTESCNKTPEPSSKIERYADIPTLWRGYTSDEEVASPVDNDDFSFDDPDSDLESTASFSAGLYHAQTCNNAQQLWSQAQAVQVVSVGKAKVVEMSKPADSREDRRNEDAAPQADFPPPCSRVNRMDLGSVYPHNNSKLNFTPASFNESYAYAPMPNPKKVEQRPRKRIVRRRPSLPILQTLPRSDSPQTTSTTSSAETRLTARRANVPELDSFPWYQPRRSQPSPSPPWGRMQKLSSSFGFRNFSRVARRVTTPESSSGEEAPTKNHEYCTKAALIADMHVPSRTSSRPLAKMVPRGANERAPLLVLPPCPDDYGEDASVPPWLPRKDSSGETAKVSAASTTVQSRRASFSAFVSTQA